MLFYQNSFIIEILFIHLEGKQVLNNELPLPSIMLQLRYDSYRPLLPSSGTEKYNLFITYQEKYRKISINKNDMFIYFTREGFAR